jgi:hypothetical protein
MTDSEYLHDLFQGSDLAYGRSEMTAAVTAKGKHEAKSWLEKRAVTLADWEGHIVGRAGIGMPPLNSKNQVRWGAIDVDVYAGLDLVKLNDTIQAAQLPLVICRSKSGGPHIFMFLAEWTPASEMIAKLDSIAGYLGFGTSEIFPKQARVAYDAKNPDYGSWINMPYFNGTKNLRYGLDQNGKALASIPEFHAYVLTQRLTKERFAALRTPKAEEIFPDGPPCLNLIFGQRPSDNRNILLANAAVYAKKAFPEDWKAKLDIYNTKFAEPLGSAEVETLKKSYDKKDYRYQCPKQPLCNYCDSSKCRKTKHGVGGGDFLPATRSLSMVATEPPLWYLDLTLPDDRSARVSLTTEQLQNPSLFQRRCMETIQRMPPSMKMEDWQPIVSALMEHCSVIDVPPETSPLGQLQEHLWDFLHVRAATGSFEDLIRGVPYRNNSTYYFRMRDLTDYLNQRRFNILKPNEIQARLFSTLKAGRGFKKVAGRGIRFIQIAEDNINHEETLQPNTFETPY